MLSGGGVSLRDLSVEEDILAEDARGELERFDASGCLVLPGIVDVHGDAFERQI